jgi:hypothetical protein
MAEGREFALGAPGVESLLRHKIIVCEGKRVSEPELQLAASTIRHVGSTARLSAESDSAMTFSARIAPPLLHAKPSDMKLDD